MSDYRCVTNLAEIRKYLGKAVIAAFDFETAPDEPYRNAKGNAFKVTSVDEVKEIIEHLEG